MLTVSMVAGGVWAYTSDRETSTSNILLAGTLDLFPMTSGASTSGNYTVTPGGNQVNGNVVFRKLQPGETGNIAWVLTNNGTINGTLGSFSGFIFTVGNSSEIKTAAGDNGFNLNGYLGQYVGVKLQRGVGTDNASATANFAYIYGSAGSYAALSGLQAILDVENVAMAANGGNDTIVYKLSWEIGSLFGSVNPNIIQGDTAQIDITFDLYQ